MSDWHRRLIRETRQLQGLSDRIEDDPVNVELAVRLLTSAAPDPSHGSAAVVDGPGTGAVRPSPHDDTRSDGIGKCPVAAPSSARVPDGTSRRAAPTTNKRPAARTTGLKDNAALETRREGA